MYSLHAGFEFDFLVVKYDCAIQGQRELCCSDKQAHFVTVANRCKGSIIRWRHLDAQHARDAQTNFPPTTEPVHLNNPNFFKQAAVMPPIQNASSSARWLTLSRRDPTANSSFFYGVTSTGIFCRPTCSGRLARRSNVTFFDSQQQALDAGYRPCKRCHPCNTGWSRESQAYNLAFRARDLMIAAEAHSHHRTVESLAQELNISSAHLHRIFKKCFNITPKSFAASLQGSISAFSTDTNGDKEPMLHVVENTFAYTQDWLALSSSSNFDLESASKTASPLIFSHWDEMSVEELIDLASLCQSENNEISTVWGL